MNPLTYHILRIAEALACACGFFSWRKWAGTPWQLFTYYLLFIVLAEAFGAYAGHHHLRDATRILFNLIVKPSQYLMAFFLFYRTTYDKTGKWLPVCFLGFYLLVFVRDLVWHQSEYFTISPTVGNLLLLLLILRFLLHLVTSDDILYFKTNMFFWVVIGYLIFYLGGLPYIGLHDYLAKLDINVFYAYRHVFLSLSAAMYLLFSIGFLWARKSAHS